jgi:para-nitrobenzyl esterase
MNTHTRLDDPMIEIASGKLCGGTTPAGYSFKGIPYGGSTAGVNRFLAPSPAPTWRGMREARDVGLRCPQNNGIIKPANAWIRDVQTTGEDCLSLNVWTPSLDDTAKRPVMVWLHGGAIPAAPAAPPA